MTNYLDANRTTRLDAVRAVMTKADFDEVDSILESTIPAGWMPRNWRRAGEMTLFYLGISIYYRRMRRHDARFQRLFAA